MKLYRIKIDDMFYVEYVVFEEKGIAFSPTYDIKDGAVYEEDKAKKYCEELNNIKKVKDEGIKFSLEEISKEEYKDYGL